MARQTSGSGAYMSQYDTEVEKRLTALEAQAHEKCCDGSGVDGETLTNLKKAIFENGVAPGTVEELTTKVDKLIEIVHSELGSSLNDD